MKSLTRISAFGDNRELCTDIGLIRCLLEGALYHSHGTQRRRFLVKVVGEEHNGDANIFVLGVSCVSWKIFENVCCSLCILVHPLLMHVKANDP